MKLVVGLFSPYRVFVNNYATAAVIAFNMPEQYEKACRWDQLNG